MYADTILYFMLMRLQSITLLYKMLQIYFLVFTGICSKKNADFFDQWSMCSFCIEAISEKKLCNCLEKGMKYMDELTFSLAIFFYENGLSGREVFTDFQGDADLKSIMSSGYNAYVVK